MIRMKHWVVWYMKRYFRYMVLGALMSCAAVNLALHVGSGLEYICQEECTLKMLKGKIHNYDDYLLEHIRNYMLDPPSPREAYKPNFNVRSPPWSKLGGWNRAHEMLMSFFDQYGNSTGNFVEVGAQDGEFMSMTLFGERTRKFSGLLIEPNPKDYEKLLSKRRAAWSINACASPFGVASKENLWLRHNSGNLPELLNKVQEGSNRLYVYVAKEDHGLGKVVEVQCLPLESMVMAALNTNKIDLLTISTHGGELDILSSLSYDIYVRVLVVLTPLPTEDETTFLETVTKKRGMVRAFSQSNIHIYLLQSEVAVVNQ